MLFPVCLSVCLVLLWIFSSDWMDLFPLALLQVVYDRHNNRILYGRNRDERLYEEYYQHIDPLRKPE